MIEKTIRPARLALAGALVGLTTLAAQGHAQVSPPGRDPAPTAPGTPTSPCGRITTVAAGETLADVAVRCAVTVQDLTRSNPRVEAEDAPEPGSELLLPVVAAHLPAATRGAAEHVVREGETLGGIARRNGTTVEALARLNPSLADTDRIVIGQRILLSEGPRTEIAPAPADAPTPAAPRPAPDAAAPEEPTPRPDGEPASERVRITPDVAFHGAELTVHASGFVPGERVTVSIGRPESGYDLVSRTRADPRGVVAETVLVPDWVVAEGSYRVAVVAADGSARLLSAPFTVRGPAGSARAEQAPLRVVELVGTVVEVRGPCPVIRLDDGRLWNLASDESTGFEAGERVRVTGTVPERSVCPAGATLDVDTLERIGAGLDLGEGGS